MNKYKKGMGPLKPDYPTLTTSSAVEGVDPVNYVSVDHVAQYKQELMGKVEGLRETISIEDVTHMIESGNARQLQDRLFELKGRSQAIDDVLAILKKGK